MTPRKRPPRDRALLHRTASAIRPRPKVLPFYIAAPDRPGLAPGWWWRPANTDRDEYLGSNVYMAEIQLLSLLTGQAAA